MLIYPQLLIDNFINRVDSIMLLEEGFEVVSVDASDKMLKYALKARWNRRKEAAFDNWSKFLFYFNNYLCCVTYLFDREKYLTLWVTIYYLHRIFM